MNSLQDVFFERLEAIAARKGHELIVQRAYTNTGRVEVMAAGTFDRVLAFTYTFNLGHNVLTGVDPQIFADVGGSNPAMTIMRSATELGPVLEAIERAL